MFGEPACLGDAPDPVSLLSVSLSSKDDETKGHCERLASRAVGLGRALRLPENEIAALDLGGMVHDVGKLFIPDTILHKPAPLNRHERAIINEHPILGERLCAPVPALAPALPIIRHHHERFDGSGYPDHLFGEQIPLVARITQIVDIFDALTSDRPYKPSWTGEQSLRTMQIEAERGWIDARLLREFQKYISSEARDPYRNRAAIAG
jgi:putative two-component system response regulator